MHPEYVYLVRLVVAGLLGAILGWERERAGKSAGFRTHIAVGIASALYTALAELSVEAVDDRLTLRSDPIRAIQAVAVGIGFLGAGMIVVNRRRDRIVGLTTAASVWATAAIGIAVGLARFRLAVGATILLVLVLRGLARFDMPDADEGPLAPSSHRPGGGRAAGGA